MNGINNLGNISLPSRTGDRKLEDAVSKAVVISGNCFFSQTRHDELLRCVDCNIKFDIHRLTRVSIGEYYCKFCYDYAMSGGVA